jgi:hypothetical protein
MIGLSKIVQEAGGAIIIHKDSRADIKRAEARVSRTATLDLGVVIDHRGYSHGDRTFRVESEVNKADADFIWAMFKTELFVNIATSDGFFYGSISAVDIDRGQLTITLLIKE